MKNDKFIMTEEEIMRRTCSLIDYGLENNMISFYEEELLDNAKNFLYNEIPLDILLMSTVATDGLCFDFASFISIINDANVIEANVLSLCNSENSKHSFAKKDGYIYDTSRGYKIKEELYYEIEKPYNIIKNKKLMTLSHMTFNQFFSKILLNVKNRDLEYFNMLNNFLITNLEEVVMSRENTIKFLLNIIKKFSEESIYNERLNLSIEEFEKTIFPNKKR